MYRYQQSVETTLFIIKHLTVEGDLVFDPCMGSSSSGVAALMNKRRYIGIEKDKDVFELAKKRICRLINTDTQQVL
jgi:DNA modification methylase